MKNIELKVKIDKLDSLSNIIKSQSSFQGTLFQKDTYYLLGKNRLKTREEGDEFEIIYYQREDKESSTDSKYFLYQINKIFFFFVKLFLNLFFGKKKVVEKRRDLYLYKNTRIHIDKVKKLGDFLELETVVNDKEKYDEYKKEHSEVIKKFNLNKFEKVAHSYSDLI